MLTAPVRVHHRQLRPTRRTVLAGIAAGGGWLAAWAGAAGVPNGVPNEDA